MDGQFTDFIDMIRQLKDTGDLEDDMEKEENQKFLTKFTIWLKESGMMYGSFTYFICSDLLVSNY